MASSSCPRIDVPSKDRPRPGSSSFRLVLLGLFISAANNQIHVSALQVHQRLPGTRTRINSHAQARLGRRRGILYATAEDSEKASTEKSPSNDKSGLTNVGRRGFLATTSAALFSLPLLSNVQPAHAGLMQFPCTRPLKNRYHFMRAGPSELEESGVYSTNSLFLTNRDNALADSNKARRIVLEACETIKASPNFPTVAYHSLAANGMDTADMMATELRISRDRLLPEFTYLDQRGIGLWDSGAAASVKPAIMALDYYEAGKEGMGGRPPPNEDGTANEVLADQFVRLRQFLSLQESRTSGENILIIFPDGTGPALLSAMIAGIPLNEAHCLDYAPGEVRLDITRESILEQYAAKKEDPTYLATLEEGKEKLAALRQQKSGEIVNLKEQQQEEQRRAIDNAFVEQRKAQREKELLEQAKREQERLEREAKDAARREQDRIQKEAKEQAARERKEHADAAARAKREQAIAAAEARKEAAAAAYAAKKSAAVVASTTPDSGSGGSDSGGVVLGAVGASIVGLAGVAFMAVGGDDETSTPPAAAVQTPSEPEPSPATTSVAAEEVKETVAVVGNNATATTQQDDVEVVVEEPEALPEMDGIVLGDNGTLSVTLPPELMEDIVSELNSRGAMNNTESIVMEPQEEEEEPSQERSAEVEAELTQLEVASEAMDATLNDVGGEEDDGEDGEAMFDTDLLQSLQEEPETVHEELDRLTAGQRAMNGYFDMDDGTDDWLQVVAEIRDAPDEDVDKVNGEEWDSPYQAVPFEFPKD